MKLFGIEISGNKKTKGRPSGKGKAASSAVDKKQKTPEKASQKNSRKVSEKLLEKRRSSLIKSMDGIPKNNGVLVVESGSPLSSNEQKHCVVLSSDEENKKAFALVSSKRISIPLDDIIEKAKSGYRRSGWAITNTYYIEPSLIDDILSEHGKKSEKKSNNSEIANEFDDILKYACDNNISDIHFEVTETKAVIRVRRNSLLEDYTQMGVEYAFDFCTVIYQVLSESDSTDISFLPRRQQSSMIVREIPGHGVVRVRLNTIPTAPSGFDMVMRVLKSEEGVRLSLEQLGYNKRLMKSLELASAKPVGALIIAGTTGSGKSTTLKTLLENKVDQFTTPNGITIKIITVEDPPEYNIEGVSQCNVQTNKGAEGSTKNPFGDAIKAAMRCDPDILMAGEVRDENSAELLMHITLSGHQVMTTIHASSAISIIARLRNNGIPNDALGNSDFLSALVYQKLVPKVCHDCGIRFEDFSKTASAEGDVELLKRIDQVIPDSKRDNIYFRNLNGCSNCRSGVTGQTVVAEVILPDHEMLSYFISGEDHKAWHHHKAMGGDTIIDHAHEKIISGTCDPRDIEVKIGLITMDLVMEDSKFEYSEMEKHGLESNEERDLEFVSMDNLNDIRLAKAIRAVKLVNAKAERGEVEPPSEANDVLFANMIHNNIFNTKEICDHMSKNGYKVNENSLDLVMEDIKYILR